MELLEMGLTEEQLTNVNSYLQSEGDKIRTKYSKEINDLKGKIPVEKSDEELAYEKEKADFKKEKAQFELSKNLQSKGLNSELSKFLNLDGVEDLETYLGEFQKIIGTKDFKPNNHTDGAKGNITKEQFNNMNYMERTNLYKTNKELYDILSK